MNDKKETQYNLIKKNLKKKFVFTNTKEIMLI